VVELLVGFGQKNKMVLMQLSIYNDFKLLNYLKRINMKKFLQLLVFSLFLSILAVAFGRIPTQMLTLNQTSISPMLKKAMPAVVNIISIGEIPFPKDPFLKKALKEKAKSKKDKKGMGLDNHFAGLGSGVIINAKKGLIVTNAHVVSMAKRITVTLKDGRRFRAKLIGADNSSDIALLSIKAKQLAQIPFGDSNTLNVGDFVAAIGNPFGLNQTVTAGIVSALHRTNLGIENFENLIQIDAPINQGNSGGALVNIKGQLVGINTAIISREDGGNLGIGFAIPSNRVQSIVVQLLKYGKVIRGTLGIYAQTLSPSLSAGFALPESQKGALITQVLKGSPANKAGLKTGDIIVNIAGHKITSNEDVHDIIGFLPLKQKTNINILRNHKKVTLHVILTPLKVDKLQEKAINHYLSGLTLKSVSEYLPKHGFVKGVRVLKIDPYSPALITGLSRGDMIVSANHHKTPALEDLVTQAKLTKKGLLLHVLKKEGSIFVVIH